MAIAYRSRSGGSDLSFTASSISATLPTGEVQNDLDIIIFVTIAALPTTAPTHTTPSGYTLADSQVASFDSTYSARISVFYRIAPASPAAVTLQAAANAALTFQRYAYSGADTTTPFVQTKKSASPILNPSAAGGGVDMTLNADTSAANALIFAYATNMNGETYTLPTGMTARGLNDGAQVWEVIQAAAGSAGTKHTDQSATADAVWFLMEFASAAAGGGSTLTPGVGSVTVGGLAPSITPKERTVAPGVGAVTLAVLAPTEAREKAIAPGLASLSLGGLAPNETDERGNVGPAVGAVSLQGLTPTLTKETLVQPGVGSAVIGGQQPTVQLPGQVLATATPDFVPIVVYGYAPTLDTGADASANRGHVNTGRRWHGGSRYYGTVSHSVSLTEAFPARMELPAQPIEPLGGRASFKPLAMPIAVAPPAIEQQNTSAAAAKRRKIARRRREEERLLSQILN